MDDADEDDSCADPAEPLERLWRSTAARSPRASRCSFLDGKSDISAKHSIQDKADVRHDRTFDEKQYHE